MGVGIGLSTGSSPAPPFTPSGLADLSLWYDASDATTITHISGSVSQWNDKSGNNYHASQSTGSRQPITGTRTINGFNALDFDGVDDRMIIDSGFYSIANGPNSVFAVVQVDNATKTEHIIISGMNSTPSTRFILSASGSGTMAAFLNGTTALTVGITLDTAAHLHAAMRNGTALTRSYDSITGSSTAGSNQTLVNVGIGARPDNGANALDGLIAEIIVYSRALSGTEETQVKNYLQSKWATP